MLLFNAQVLWTDYYSQRFVLFVALAVLESHRDVILRYLVEVSFPIHPSDYSQLTLQQFDEVLKYCNELSMTIELDSTLAQAEVLFLSFAQIVSDIDRRKAVQDAATAAGEGLRRRNVPSTSGNGSPAGSGASTPGKDALTDVEMPEISEYLRELLDNGHTHAQASA